MTLLSPTALKNIDVQLLPQQQLGLLSRDSCLLSIWLWALQILLIWAALPCDAVSDSVAPALLLLCLCFFPAAAEVEAGCTESSSLLEQLTALPVPPVRELRLGDLVGLLLFFDLPRWKLILPQLPRWVVMAQ